MKSSLRFLAMAMIAGGALYAQPRLSIGVGVGTYGPGYYPPPPPYASQYAPPCPGPDYTWVDGYWYGYGPRRVWRPGYWAAPHARFGYRR